VLGQGRLLLEGTLDDPIRLTGMPFATDNGTIIPSWRGITLEHPQQPSNLSNFALVNVTGPALITADSMSDLSMANAFLGYGDAIGVTSSNLRSINLDNVTMVDLGSFGFFTTRAAMTAYNTTLQNVSRGIWALQADLNRTHILNCSMGCINTVQGGTFHNSSFSGDGSLRNTGISSFISGSSQAYRFAITSSTFEHLAGAIAISAGPDDCSFVARHNTFRNVGTAVQRTGGQEGTVIFEHNNITTASSGIVVEVTLSGDCIAQRSNNISISHNVVFNSTATTGFAIGYIGAFAKRGLACLLENNTFVDNTFSDSVLKVDLAPARAYYIRDNKFTDNRGGALLRLVSGGDVGTQVNVHNNSFSSSLADFDIASTLLLGQGTINASLNHWSVSQASLQERISSSKLPMTFQPIIVEPVSSALGGNVPSGPLRRPDGSLGGSLNQNLTLDGAEYTVSSTIHVASNATLRLEAGVILRVAIGAQLIVDGGLVTMGTPDDPVLMLPQSAFMASDVRQGQVLVEEEPIESIGIYANPAIGNFTSLNLGVSCSRGCNSQALCSAACLKLDYTIFRTGTIRVSGGFLSGTCYCGKDMISPKACTSRSGSRWYAVAIRVPSSLKVLRSL
jgi:hypothetical protein